MMEFMDRGAISVAMQRTVSQRTVKKVSVPDVPQIAGMVPIATPPPPAVTTSTTPRASTSSYGSIGQDDAFPPPPPAPVPSKCKNGEIKPHQNHGKTFAAEVQLNGTGSPRHRNSTGSNSSQASSGFESMKSTNASSTQYVNVQVHSLRGDSPPSRNSYHSSDGSSSLGSLERLDESGFGIGGGSVNVAEMLMNGCSDVEIVTAWLHSLHFDDYIPLFLRAGYDLATIARTNPQDLCMIGVNKPGHRKRLMHEIHQLKIVDGWPETKPASVREWLQMIGLPEYTVDFERQGCTNMDEILQYTQEDFEDIGVNKLGHLKKLTLAAKKMKDHKQCRLLNGMSNSTHVNGELLVINVPQKLAAEVRPYSHLPTATEHQEDFQCEPASPPMKTFQSTSRFSPFSNGLLLNSGAGFSSPEHPPQIRQNFQQNLHAAEVHAANHLAVETFPPRPKVSVKPRPVATIVAKTKRGSREIPQDIIYHEKQIAQQNENDEVGNCNPYVNVLVGNDDLSLNVSPRRLPDGLGMSPSRSNTLKRPPPVPAKKPDHPAVFQLSKKVDPLGDSAAEVSPAPSSLEDFPPPPFPLACEDSINALKTMRSESNGVALAPKLKRMSHESSSSIDSNSSSESGSLLPFAQENVGTIKQRSVDTVQQDGDMIWLNKAAQMPNDRRRHVQDVFLAHQQKSSTAALPYVPKRLEFTTINTPAKGGTEVLDEIGTMLQGLTDELDAMLLSK